LIPSWLMEKIMARPVTGDEETIEIAQIAILQATTLDELRQAQAVLLPLLYGLSLQQTAQVIGVSVGWACQLRRRFIAGRFVGAAGQPAPGGRKRQNMSVEQEREFLAPFIEQAQIGGVLVVGQIKAALDKRLGRAVSLSSTYNLLHRHDWRKLVPDKHHPQSDPLAQAEWKKNSPKHSATSSKTGRAGKPSS
jgi:transposase